uniref:Reticulon-like protein n=1 Tax=Panagrellus redivivus TaxID=6233 RepID=A0A7E5A221_PANRE
MVKPRRSTNGRSQEPEWIPAEDFVGKVLDVVYWRDPKKSGAILGAILVGLLLISKFSLLSLLAYLSLAALVGTIGYRVYNLVLARLNKSDGANPFTPYLAQELEVPQEKVHAQVDVLLENGKAAADKLKRLFLVEKVCESVKFGLLLWTLTYIGAWFSGLGLVTLFVIGVFSIPKVYEIYKEPIDANLAVVKEHLDKVQAIIAEKAPFLACGSTAAPAKKEE